MVNPDSLGRTLDAINEAYSERGELSTAQKEEVAKWIAGRQYRSGRNAGMFAPTARDLAEGVRLFTGEKLKTKLATRNVCTCEVARALCRMGISNREVGDTLERAEQWMVQQCFSQSCTIGECAHASAAYLRYLAGKGGQDTEKRLDAHIRLLAQHRDGKGRWRRFPFYYTLLVLAEIERPLAVEEMRYAAPACERVLGRSSGGDGFAERRRSVVERVLTICRS